MNRLIALIATQAALDSGRYPGLQLWHGSTLLAGAPRVWVESPQEALAL